MFAFLFNPTPWLDDPADEDRVEHNELEYVLDPDAAWWVAATGRKWVMLLDDGSLLVARRTGRVKMYRHWRPSGVGLLVSQLGGFLPGAPLYGACVDGGSTMNPCAPQYGHGGHLPRASVLAGPHRGFDTRGWFPGTPEQENVLAAAIATSMGL